MVFIYSNGHALIVQKKTMIKIQFHIQVVQRGRLGRQTLLSKDPVLEEEGFRHHVHSILKTKQRKQQFLLI